MCKQVTALYVGRMMKPRVRVDKIVFRVHATRDQRGALALPVPRRGTGFQDQEDDGGNSSAPLSRLQRIWGTAHVYTQTDTSQAQIDVLAAEVKERCPIANMVQLSGCELDIDFIQAEEDEDQEEKQP